MLDTHELMKRMQDMFDDYAEKEPDACHEYMSMMSTMELCLDVLSHYTVFTRDVEDRVMSVAGEVYDLARENLGRLNVIKDTREGCSNCRVWKARPTPLSRFSCDYLYGSDFDRLCTEIEGIVSNDAELSKLVEIVDLEAEDFSEVDR